jgi:hypothetical protein
MFSCRRWHSGVGKKALRFFGDGSPITAQLPSQKQTIRARLITTSQIADLKVILHPPSPF